MIILQSAVSDNMISNARDSDVLTSVLTIESVSLNDNGNGYFCSPSFGIGSDVGVISVVGENEHLHVFMYLYVASYCIYFIMSVTIIIQFIWNLAVKLHINRSILTMCVYT